MREIVSKRISEVVKKLVIEANTSLSESMVAALNRSLTKEKSPTGRDILRQILNNAKIAWRDKLPLCQDTGIVTVFVEKGHDISIVGGNLRDAINEGVRQGYAKGCLRKSMVNDPLERKNTEDNVPAIIHCGVVPGEQIRIRLLTKGGGAENCSAIKMFQPSSTKEEISEFILATVFAAGANACPPVIVGVGIGGSFDYAPILAKKALLRDVGQASEKKETAAWEKELLDKINKSGIGPMGLGGTTTALAVQIERHPCHISCLPVAVNLECHAHRAKEAVF
ncbi:MAG: fumarate hydratase [bacterium]